MSDHERDQFMRVAMGHKTRGELHFQLLKLHEVVLDGEEELSKEIGHLVYFLVD